MQLFELICLEDCRDHQIRDRAESSKKTKHTCHFVARDAKSELAFIALDLNTEFDYLVLYEIFVPQSIRRKGIGTAVLVEVERIAQSRGFRRVIVYPKPFVGSMTKSQLVEWYKSQGYVERRDFPEELEKTIEIQFDDIN